MTLLGGSGGAAHDVEPGKVSVTGFDGALIPDAFTARTMNVRVPVGTPAKLNASVTPSGSVATIDPSTSKSRDVGAPPEDVFCQTRLR